MCEIEELNMPKGVYLRTAQTRAKQSMAAKRRVLRDGFSPEIRAKISAANMGHQTSLETRTKLSVAQTGKKHSPETRAKISIAQQGQKNHRWLGGMSLYAFSFTPELKNSIRERDGHVCQQCGVHQLECTKLLNIHHIDYDKKNSDPVNLVALCVHCHMRTNSNRSYWTAFFQAAMIEREVSKWPI